MKLANKIFFLLSLIFLVSSCKEEDNINDSNYFGGKIMILGHRGMGDMYRMPGNTINSIEPLINIGADGSEIDVQLSKDSVLVLFHNQYLDECTTCNGRIFEYNWGEIKECKYIALVNNIYVNSVEDVFDRIQNLNNYYFSFDCKVFEDIPNKREYQRRFIRAIERLCSKYNMNDNIFLEGDYYFLLEAKRMGISNRLFLIANIDQNSIDTIIKNDFFGVSCYQNQEFKDVESLHKKGKWAMLWAPSSYNGNKKALELRVDIIQTDEPISMLKLLNRYNYDYTIP